MFKLLLLFLCFGLVWSFPLALPGTVFQDFGRLLDAKLNRRSSNDASHLLLSKLSIRSPQVLPQFVVPNGQPAPFQPAPQPAPPTPPAAPNGGGQSSLNWQSIQGGRYTVDPVTGRGVIHYDARMLRDHIDNTVNFADPNDSVRTMKGPKDPKNSRNERLRDKDGKPAASTKGMANDEVRPYGRAQILTEQAN